MIQGAKRIKARESNAGVTLIELMFAAGVLSVALGILFGALLTLYVMGRVAEGRGHAAMALAGTIEEVRNLSHEQLLQYSPEPITFEGLEIGVFFEAVTEDGELLPLPLDASAGEPAALPVPTELRATALWSGIDGRVFSASVSMVHGR